MMEYDHAANRAKLQAEFEEYDRVDCERWAEFTRVYVPATAGPFAPYDGPKLRTKEQNDRIAGVIYGPKRKPQLVPWQYKTAYDLMQGHG